MSININWENITGGEDGAALAETIRAFVHDRFQQVPLPTMIRSVQVHSFDFGTVAPELELKDVSDPLSDFYDAGDNDGDNDDDDMPSDDDKNLSSPDERFDQSNPPLSRPRYQRSSGYAASDVPQPWQQLGARTQSPSDMNSFLSRASTPGIPGGTSNPNYFHQPLAAGLSGAAMPFAAVAAAQRRLPHGGSSADITPPTVQSSNPRQQQQQRRRSSASKTNRLDTNLDKIAEGDYDYGQDQSPDEVQVVMRLKYAGDVEMTLTADILLDYPMPSFVGIPLQLKVTGMSFDGIAVLAYIKSKAHFCFLAPEDADALVGRDEPASPAGNENVDGSGLHGEGRRGGEAGGRVGGLFEMIKVESEIGQRAGGKQVLKNVGKVEKFVLEQVRRIFEAEFVYPSFWTFLV